MRQSKEPNRNEHLMNTPRLADAAVAERHRADPGFTPPAHRNSI